MAALHLDRFFPRSPFRSTANVRVRFGFGRTVYGNHASSAVCGSAGAVSKLYLDGRTRKSPVHSPNLVLAANGGLTSVLIVWYKYG